MRLPEDRTERGGHPAILTPGLAWGKEVLRRRVAFLLVIMQLGPMALLPRSIASEAGPAALRLSVGTGRLTVEVARTHEELSRGLMFRRSLGEDAGMLFLLPREGVASFWMANTTIPLSVAFLDRRGEILEIHDLQPLDTRIVSSRSARVRFALEVNRDWFSRHGVRVGQPVRPEGVSWEQIVGGGQDP
ncbi:DUF192 domain-containing protein [Methylacidimicrobium sp. AP8]|uniref:DUF192 domain-containing protein n=1 Tax=Methylacidimicrobium sp. AP8 TaxID=2730359 RepID=UPI001920B268|nr:DUF192 domain-containing protein [Methylacidimicrobium sp. AP8]